MGIPIPPATASALQARCTGTVDNLLTSYCEGAEIRIYTDGGATRGTTKKAAWGAAAFLFFPSGCFQLIGIIHGGVQTSRSLNDFLGAAHLTNNTAELTAVTWMLAWMLGMFHEGLSPMPVTIFPDSTYVRGQHHRRRVSCTCQQRACRDWKSPVMGTLPAPEA